MISPVNSDIARWNERYRCKGKNNLPTPVGELELIQNQDYLEGKGLAVEMACGKGKNALYLASLGYHVVACDGSINGLKLCQSAANNLQLPISPLACDLKIMQWPEKCFDFISVVRFLHRPLFEKIKASVKPGGIVFYKTFNSNCLIEKPDFNADYVLRPGELNDVFSDFEVICGDDESNQTVGKSSFIFARRVSG